MAPACQLTSGQGTPTLGSRLIGASCRHFGVLFSPTYAISPLQRERLRVFCPFCSYGLFLSFLFVSVFFWTWTARRLRLCNPSYLPSECVSSYFRRPLLSFIFCRISSALPPGVTSAAPRHWLLPLLALEAQLVAALPTVQQPLQDGDDAVVPEAASFLRPGANGAVACESSICSKIGIDLMRQGVRFFSPLV